MGLRYFVPQFLVDFAYWATRWRNGMVASFETWDVATTKCTGYETHELVADYVRIASNRFTKELSTPQPSIEIPTSMRFMASLTAACVQSDPKHPLTVLDFGGGTGVYYPELTSHLSFRDYTIVETAAVVEGLKQFGNAVLSWKTFDQIPLGTRFDAVFSASALQYTPKPFDFLRQLMGHSDVIILDRMPLADIAEDLILKQNVVVGNGRRISYPLWIFSRTKFEKFLRENGYEKVLDWVAPEDRPFIRGHRMSYSGLVFRKY